MERKEIGKLIKEIRLENGIKSGELSKKLGLCASSISLVESGERNFYEEKINTLSEMLNLSEEKTMELKDASARFLNKIPRYMIDKLLEDDELFEYVKRYKKN